VKTQPRRRTDNVPGELKIKHNIVASIEAELLRRVRMHDGLSRVELARQLGIAPSTVGGYVDRLIVEGFLFEGRKGEREMGRPPTLLALNPSGGRFVGVDFDAHNIRGTVVDFSQKPLRQIHETILHGETVEQIICKIERVISDLVNGDARKILGIGIGVPGTIDPKKQIALHYAHISGWENIRLGERLSRRFGVSIFLENNIRTMALAELWFGRERALETFVCLGIRTGVGAGIVVRRRLVHGRNHLAGEIGDWLCPVAPIQPGGSESEKNWCCTQLKPLEKIASIPAIVETVRMSLKKKRHALLVGKKDRLTFPDVVRAAQLGDPVVIEILAKIARTLGWTICQINALINPQKIVIAGPLITLGNTFLAPLKNAVREFSAPLRQGAPIVTDSELGEFNGALGAAALALHEWKPKR
jgi:glucokinase